MVLYKCALNKQIPVAVEIAIINSKREEQVEISYMYNRVASYGDYGWDEIGGCKCCRYSTLIREGI